MINTPLSLERDLGIVVVGLGAIGLEHAAVAMSTPGISLVGVVEPREAERERFAHTNQVNSYRSFDEALADSQVEAVILCTPDHLHFEDAVRTITAGRHLLLEKPIATTRPELTELVRLAEQTQSVVMPGQTLRFEHRYAYAHEVVASDHLGEISHGYLRRNNRTEVARRASGRVSVAMFLGVHDIDALLWVTGESVVEVQAMATDLRDPSGSQAQAIMGMLRLEGGGVVQIESAWNLPASYPTDLDATMRLVGTAGVLEVPSFDSGIRIATGGFALPMTSGRTLYDQAQGPLALEQRAFASACQGAIPNPVTVREAARAVEVVLALEEALASGAPVTVPKV